MNTDITVCFKIKYLDDHKTIVLTNSNGDTYTSKSEELQDFLFTAKQSSQLSISEDELVLALEEYIKFLDEGNKGANSMAYVHGYRFPQHLIDKGIELREKISKLKAAQGNSKYTIEDIKNSLQKGVNIGMQNVEQPKYEGDYNFNQKKCIQECSEYIQSLTEVK